MPAKATRAAFGEALLELGARDERIVTLDADLSKSTMTAKFAKTYPQRAFNVGIAESNMIGIGAGLALTGRIPFVCSFACFVVGRFETIRISVAYTNANVKIVGTHAGIAIGEDGYSQMGLEDVACLRALPNVPIVQPADELEAKQAVAWAVEHQGPVYLRLTRQNLEAVSPADYRFQLGRWLTLRPGTDVTVIASGGTVFNPRRPRRWTKTRWCARRRAPATWSPSKTTRSPAASAAPSPKRSPRSCPRPSSASASPASANPATPRACTPSTASTRPASPAA